jgi:hypothetical protein
MSNLDHAVREYLALLALSVGFRLLAASTDDDARPGSPRRRPVQSHLVTVGLSRLVNFHRTFLGARGSRTGTAGVAGIFGMNLENIPMTRRMARDTGRSGEALASVSLTNSRAWRARGFGRF